MPRKVRHAATGVTNLIIGSSAQDTGVANPALLMGWLRRGFETGISLNHEPKEHLVLVLQNREDSASDDTLCCLTLRSLWDNLLSFQPHRFSNRTNSATQALI